MASNGPPTDHLDKTPTFTADSKCAICLIEPIDKEAKAFPNNCLHEFCFPCLKSWSLVKRECPLCKQGFSSILHSVKPNNKYEEYEVPIPESQETTTGILPQILHLAASFIADHYGSDVQRVMLVGFRFMSPPQAVLEFESEGDPESNRAFVQTASGRSIGIRFRIGTRVPEPVVDIPESPIRNEPAPANVPVEAPHDEDGEVLEVVRPPVPQDPVSSAVSNPDEEEELERNALIEEIMAMNRQPQPKRRRR